MNEKWPIRKTVRLKGYDYNSPGYYFVTICTKDKRKLLCDIVGTVVLDGPQIRYTRYGKIAKEYLESMRGFYEGIRIDKYVIMPNHVHLLIQVLDNGSGLPGIAPSIKSKVGRLVGTFKRLTNMEYGNNICKAAHMIILSVARRIIKKFGSTLIPIPSDGRMIVSILSRETLSGWRAFLVSLY